MERLIDRASKRAEEEYPIETFYGEHSAISRECYKAGYERGEKDTIKRAIKWLENNVPQNIEYTLCIRERFRKAMEEDYLEKI